MNENERYFLLLEFETAWDHLRMLDSRRFQIFQFHTAFTGIAVGGGISIFQLSSLQEKYLFLSCFFISLMLFFYSFLCRKLLKEEIRAGMRYRKKITEIREIFIANTEDKKISRYIILGKNYSVDLSQSNDNSFCVSNFLKQKEKTVFFYITLFMNTISFISLIIAAFFLMEFLSCPDAQVYYKIKQII